MDDEAVAEAGARGNETTAYRSDTCDPSVGLVDPSALYRSHCLRLVRLAAMLVGDQETAEDIVQDVFARLHDRWRRFRGSDQALRYVRACVLNGARSTLRRRRTENRHRSESAPNEPSAERLALTRLREATVRQTVMRLPRRQQEVILLRYLEDMSVVETARTLRISQAAVKSSTSRAMKSLAVMLGAEQNG